MSSWGPKVGPWRGGLWIGILVGMSLHHTISRLLVLDAPSTLPRSSYVDKAQPDGFTLHSPSPQAVTTNSPLSSTLGCKNQLYTQGRWVKADGDSSTIKNTSTSIDYASLYTWQVDDAHQCHLDEWDRDLFCQTLQGRSILLVGDSINLQWFEFLQQLLNDDESRQQVHQYQIMTHKRHPVHASVSICGDNNTWQRLTFLRNDHLQIAQDLAEHVDKQAIHIPWFHLIPQHDILVLNTGAHAKGRLVSDYRLNIQQIQEYLTQQLRYSGTVVWRTTPRGHIGCTAQDTKPIWDGVNSAAWQRYYDPSNKPVYTKYNYNRIPKYNRVLREEIGRNMTKTTTTMLHNLLLDVATLTELRPDGHANPPKDCLHYRVMDVYIEWTRLLMNALQGHL